MKREASRVRGEQCARAIIDQSFRSWRGRGVSMGVKCERSFKLGPVIPVTVMDDDGFFLVPFFPSFLLFFLLLLFFFFVRLI